MCVFEGTSKSSSLPNFRKGGRTIFHYVDEWQKELAEDAWAHPVGTRLHPNIRLQVCVKPGAPLYPSFIEGGGGRGELYWREEKGGEKKEEDEKKGDNYFCTYNSNTTCYL